MLTLAELNPERIDLVKWIPLLPFAAMVICGLLCAVKIKAIRALAAPAVIAATLGVFVLSILVYTGMGNISEYVGRSVHGFTWIEVGNFAGNFSFYVDPLTIIMLFVISGVGTLIAVYASGYMRGDPGYARFFAYVGLFIFAMSCVVTADNLLLLYLGWEGVGVASYLLIGYYYRKPSAVAAAKKAFIVNRIGDFGFALGIFTCYMAFGSIQYDAIIPAAQALMGQVAETDLAPAAAAAYAQANAATDTLLHAIPLLLLLGALGKSAQLPLSVWLPDAMEGPTPVSALIHAATMVTSGVYMIARLLPMFEYSPYALPIVAGIGAVTAIYGATTALCQNDIKRVFAYSTVSQLGYMFLAVGVLSPASGMFHLLTHAFFKALLFLTAGNVMHAMAGQLDLYKISGLWRKMPVTAILMLIGALTLAGFPFTAGFFSKDAILVYAYMANPVLGIAGIAVAFCTAFYAFRVWFRIFLGPTEYEMGHEHHGYVVEHTPDDHHHGPHEMNWLHNGPLVVLALGCLSLGFFAGDWVKEMVAHSTGSTGHLAIDEVAYDHAHHVVLIATVFASLSMIVLAGYFHWINRGATERITGAIKPLVRILHRKWYLDELYHYTIVMPLRVAGYVFYLVFDRFILDGLIIDGALQNAPKLAAEAQTPMHRGKLQGVAVAMGAGLVLVLAIVAYAVMK